MNKPKSRRTLLDLDRLPTKEELREYFCANDWTTDKPYDFSKWEPERVEELNYVKSVLDSVWNENAKKYGQKAPPVCYTSDYHPEVLRKSVSDIVCGSVVKIANDDKLLEEALTPFLDDENVEEKADNFVNNAVDALSKPVWHTDGYIGIDDTAERKQNDTDFT